MSAVAFFVIRECFIEGAYRITYVTDEDGDDDLDIDGDDDDDDLHESRQQLRSLSLDSFDKFCRSGSVGKEDRRKDRHQARVNGDNCYGDDDEDDDDSFVRRELQAVSPAAEDIEGRCELCGDMKMLF